MRNNAKTTVGLLLATMTVLIWGITFINTKYLLRSFSPLEILVVRFIAAYIGLWIVSPHILHLKKRKHELIFALGGLTGVTLYQFAENIAISYTSAGNVSVIVSICPMLTAITAQIFLHEKHLTLRFMLGFIAAISGIALVSFNGAAVLHLNPKGDFLALAAAVSWSFYSLAVSKINSHGYSSAAATRRIFFWAIVFMTPLGISGIHTSSINPLESNAVFLDKAINAGRFSQPKNILNILFLGFGASAFCFAAWNVACRILGTVRASAGIYLIPVVTLVFAFFLLGEKFTLLGVLGAFLTVAGLFFSAGGKHSENAT